MNIIHGIPPVQPKGTWVGVDSELYTKKGDVKHLHRPTTGEYACITIATNDEDVYFIDDVTQVPQALANIDGCVWVIQNAAFDITHFRRWANVPPRKKLFDTMLIERILFNGYYDQFGLQSLVRRYLKVRLDKEIRDEFEGATHMTPEQIEYACMDAHYVRKVALKQRELMTPEDRKLWQEIELPVFWAMLDMKGFRLDVDKWKEVAAVNQRNYEEIEATLPFNPNSPTQVKAWMLANGFKKLESTEADVLEDAMRKWPNTKAAEMASRVLEARKYRKNASTYGIKFVDIYLEEESPGVYVIRANYKQIGAETGRTSCSNPNMQNIPARETKVYRECFIARPGHKLVIADFGAQEPRLLAYVSGDEYLIQHFNGGSDVYISLAKDIFDIVITKKDKAMRNKMKSVVLAIGYGMTKYGMAEQLQVSTDEAEHLIVKGNQILIGASRWGDAQAKLRVKIVTPFGRVQWLNPYSGQVERNARNSPIQGGAADMMKKVLARMYAEWPFPFEWCLVAVVHDEAVFDFPIEYADEGEAFVKRYMEDVSTEMVGGKIKFIAEVYAGNTWAEK
jgi:DNA polymerase-1